MTSTLFLFNFVVEMDLREIINRPDDVPIEEEESYFVIREYIKIRKGKNVNPRIETRFGHIYSMQECHLMLNMLNYAIIWLRENKYKC